MSDDLPDTAIERANMLEGILIGVATGGDESDNHIYMTLRQEFMDDVQTRALLPSFVRTHRNLSAFWAWIKHEEKHYADRRKLIRDAFAPLMDFLEGWNRVPADHHVSDVLTSFDRDGVSAVWSKALDRRQHDPEGAITVARTLLETVCKRILEERSVDYSDGDDLPTLYSRTAKTLRLAPDQHTEKPIKAILGGAMNTVNGIGTLRNKMSDAHGRGGRLPVRPLPRHANLAVNMAGTVAMFLLETHQERQP